MTNYIGLIRKEPDSDFGVDFPDFPGCIIAGRTMGEAREMAGEALAAHVALMIDDGDVIPPPSSFETAIRVRVPPASTRPMRGRT